MFNMSYILTIMPSHSIRLISVALFLLKLEFIFTFVTNVDILMPLHSMVSLQSSSTLE